MKWGTIFFERVLFAQSRMRATKCGLLAKKWGVTKKLISHNFLWHCNFNFIFLETRSYAADAGGGHRLNRRARIKFWREYFGCSQRQRQWKGRKWWFFAESVDFLSLMGVLTDWKCWFFATYGCSKWLKVLTFRYSQGVSNDWKSWFFVAHGGFHMNGSVDFSLLMGSWDLNWPLFRCLEEGQLRASVTRP